MSRWRTEVIGDCILHNADCLEVLETLGKVDAVVTDPPYGISADRERKSEKWGWKDYPGGGWDNERPTANAIASLIAAAPHVVIWGGNYFALPPSSKWLVWDKGQTDFSLADCELAWCSFDGAVRRIEYPRSKALQDGKEHPTQKPVEVMRWCLERLPKGCNTILDPYMGSGTTGVACVSTGRHFIGIEREPIHFATACRRIEQAYKQPDFFVAPPTKVKQEVML